MGFHITYNIWYSNYIVQTKVGEALFKKDKMVLPYINVKKPQDMAFVKTIQEIFEGLTKTYINVTKIACKYQVMIGCPYAR